MTTEYAGKFEKNRKSGNRIGKVQFAACSLLVYHDTIEYHRQNGLNNSDDTST